MTSTWFAVTLGIIGFLTGMMGFSEDISKLDAKLKFIDELPTKLVVLLIATFGTILATTSYNMRTDANSDSKLHIQDSIATLKQNERDSINRSHVDSINKNTTEILAKYGLKVDSANNAIVKAMDTSMGKNTPELEYYSVEQADVKFKHSQDSFYFPLGLINTGNGVAYDVRMNLAVFIETIWGFEFIQPTNFFGDAKMNIGIRDSRQKPQLIVVSPNVLSDTIFLGMKASWKAVNRKPYHYNAILSFITKSNYISEYDVEKNQSLSIFLKKVNYKN